MAIFFRCKFDDYLQREDIAHTRHREMIADLTRLVEENGRVTDLGLRRDPDHDGWISEARINASGSQIDYMDELHDMIGSPFEKDLSGQGRFWTPATGGVRDPYNGARLVEFEVKRGCLTSLLFLPWVIG